jgi:hypothetical protein
MAAGGQGQEAEGAVMDWSIYLEAAGPKDALPLDEDAVELFSTCLDAYSPAVTGAITPEQTPMWSVQLTIQDAEEPTQAAERALRAALEAADKAGLPAWPLVKLEATEWERFDAELDQPNTPDLVGVAELAELCGVSRQRASFLARSEGFPEPLAELASGPVWDLRMVQRFVRDWPRKPGRPARAASAAADESNVVVALPSARRRTTERQTAASARTAVTGRYVRDVKTGKTMQGRTTGKAMKRSAATGKTVKKAVSKSGRNKTTRRD